MGNRTLEEVRDPANALAQTRSRVYQHLNRLFQEIGATSQTTEYTYDDQGNVLTVKDPLNRDHHQPVRRAQPPEAGHLADADLGGDAVRLQRPGPLSR